MKINKKKITEKVEEQVKPEVSTKKTKRVSKTKTAVSAKPKLTLAQKQEQRLKIQQEREAVKEANGGAKNKERFYCTNAELQAELIKWRDSNLEAEKKLIDSGKPINYVDRTITDELGKMILAIGNKLLNHSNFRNYAKELKEDMLSYGVLKVIKGLKNYNFKFNNPFAWVTQAFYNSYLIIINKHYKHINIRKELMKKYFSELEGIDGISANSLLTKCIKNYISDDGSADDLN